MYTRRVGVAIWVGHAEEIGFNLPLGWRPSTSGIRAFQVVPARCVDAGDSFFAVAGLLSATCCLAWLSFWLWDVWYRYFLDICQPAYVRKYAGTAGGIDRSIVYCDFSGIPRFGW